MFLDRTNSLQKREMVSVLSYFKQVMAFFARYANGHIEILTGAWREKL